MDMFVAKIAGVVFVSIVFVVTVLLMPWIFGVNPPSGAAEKQPDVPPPAPAAMRVPPPATAQPVKRPVKR